MFIFSFKLTGRLQEVHPTPQWRVLAQTLTLTCQGEDHSYFTNARPQLLKVDLVFPKHVVTLCVGLFCHILAGEMHIKEDDAVD